MRSSTLAGIARTTALDGLRQPIFLVLVGLSMVLVYLSKSFTLFGFGVELNMVRETGLSSLRLLGFLLAVFLGLGGLGEEFDRRRLFTVLSKPVSRAEVILGRFLGVLGVIGVGSLLVLSILCLVLWQVEGKLDPLILVGALFAFVESSVLLAMAHLFGVVLPLLPGAVCCLAVFSLGHLSNWLVGLTHGEGGSALLGFLGRVVHVALPNLQHFNVVTAIASGHQVPLAYVSLTLLYALGYISLVLGLSVALFQHREVD